MATFTGLAQLVDGPARHHFTAMANKRIKHFLEVQNLWLAVDQRHHVDTEHCLQLGVGEQVVHDHFGVLTTAKLNHHPDAFLVGFITQFGDAFQALFLDQFSNLFDQPCLVQLVRQFGDDDGVAIGLLVVLNLVAGADVNAATASAIGFNNAGTAVDDALGREIRARNNFHQLINGQVRVINQRQATINHFGQVMGRNVGRHTHGDTGRTIHQQVRYAGWQNFRDTLGAVVVVDEIHGFLVQVRQQRMGNLLHADFGVTHGGGVVTVDRTEVTLAIHQRVAQGERLSHTNDGVVNGRVTMGVIFTDNVTHHTGGFLVCLVPVVTQLGHGEQHPTMHRLKAVTHIWQSPADDNAHSVIEVGLLQFVFNTDRQDLFG